MIDCGIKNEHLKVLIWHSKQLEKQTKTREDTQLRMVNVFSRADFTQFHLTEKEPFDPELGAGKAKAFFQLRNTFEKYHTNEGN